MYQRSTEIYLLPTHVPKPPACIHGISGYTHAKHEEQDTPYTATEGEASS